MLIRRLMTVPQFQVFSLDQYAVWFLKLVFALTRTEILVALRRLQSIAYTVRPWLTQSG